MLANKSQTMKPNKLALATTLALAAFTAKADSISPTTFSDTVDVGGSTTVHKVVTVSAGRPTTSLVDVFFLADTTGSMGGAIASVEASAATILANTSGLGNVQYGVGEYKDVGDVFVYRLNQDITGNAAAVTAGINAWGASGGGDFPEANLFALKQVADTTTWRAGSRRILTWFGDAPGHDPSAGVSEAQATAALQAQGIQVEAIDIADMNDTGQALRIANATGGHYYSGIASGDVADAIEDAITTAFATYNTVGLDLTEVPAGVTATLAPLGYAGVFDRSIERTFEFDLTFTGVAPGTYDFNVYATVDGGRVATEGDRIVVRDTSSPVPEAGTSLMLLGMGALSLFGIRRKISA